MPKRTPDVEILVWRHKQRAREAVLKAVSEGRLVRPERCEQCGREGTLNRRGALVPIQAHHCDYNKPLAVMWLCSMCHSIWHRSNTAIEPNVKGDSANDPAEDLEGSAVSTQPADDT